MRRAARGWLCPEARRELEWPVLAQLASTSPLVSVVGGGLCLRVGLEGGGDTDAYD